MSIDLVGKEQSEDNVYGVLGAGVYEFSETILSEMNAKGVANFYMILHVTFKSSTGFTTEPIVLESKPVEVTSEVELPAPLNKSFDDIVFQLEEYEGRGWRINQLVRLDLHYPLPIMHAGQALDGVLEEFSIDLEKKEQSAENIFEVLRAGVYGYRRTIISMLQQKRALKIFLSLHVNFHQSIDPDFFTEPTPVLNTDPVEILASTNINETLDEIYDALVDAVEHFEMIGSGWVLDQLLRLDLHVLEFIPLRASSYLPLPSEVEEKHAVINIKNSDNQCFLWSVIAGVFGDPKAYNLQRVAQYRQWEGEFDLTGIEMPMALKDIPKFERCNDISVSVYGYKESKKNTDGVVEEEGFAYTLRVVKEVKPRHVNLLLISNDDTNHYCLIKNFSRLVRSQVTNRNTQHHFCRFCLHGFTRANLLEAHEGECYVHGGQKTVFPENTSVEFTSIAKQLKAPFVVFADFESVLEVIDDQRGGNTKKYQHHVACSYMYIIVSDVPGVTFKRKLYVGVDAASHLLDSLQRDFDNIIMPIIEDEKEMIFDEAARQKYDSALNCHICEQSLENDKVRDHDHLTGTFRGAAHNHCNFEYAINVDRYKLPIFFHNLKNYDAHLIMQAVTSKHKKIDVIPNNMERYVSFSIGRLKFLDSLQFLPCSLAELVASMSEDDLHHLRRAFPDVEQWKLLSRKGVYPYDYMDTMEKFDATQLPTREQFYSKLDEEQISVGEYAHAQNVWRVFGCKTMRDYHDLYLSADVLLLADVFQQFREMSMDVFGLEAVHYYSLPGLSWDALLKHSHVKLELIVDIDMYQMVERGMRGGVSMVSCRYAEAKEPSEEDPFGTSLIYTDANSLYPTAMRKYLPVDGFEWADVDVDVMQVADDADVGYILEVDLEYPDHLHDTHNVYPLAPEKMTITPDMLSPFQKQHFPNKRITEKLVPNLKNKTKYVLHYHNLKLYLQLGMKLTKVHCIIKFNQAPWMKSFIELNINKRKEASIAGNNVNVKHFKYTCNASFGKTMENVRKRVNIELLTNRKFALKRIAKPNFKRSKKFHDELIAIHAQKMKLELSRPIQVGFAILDISKVHMYDFHYNTWMVKFPQSTLLFTDTDSLTYTVEGADLAKGMGEIKDQFDFSGYPTTHALHDKTNMKEVGKFKDELNGCAMKKFVGLRPKLYSFVYDKDGELVEKNTAKGVKRKTKNTKLSFADYHQSLRTMTVKKVSMNTIRSDHHKIYTQTTTKIGLSGYDDKRYICEDGVRTVAHGHYRTR